MRNDPGNRGNGGDETAVRSEHAQTAIEAVNLSKTLQESAVVKGVDLTVRAGTVHGIVGPNGAGKTTLLRLLNGIYTPDKGEVRVLGQVLTGDTATVRQRVHLVSADGGFHPGFRVKDLLRYASLLYPNWDKKRADDLIQVLKLDKQQLIRRLSLGTKMQLRLAVALASRPDVLILDEPTNGLDPVVRHQFLGLIVQEVAGRNISVVFATHRLEELEAMADDISVLHDGRILLSGNLEDLKMEHREIVAVTRTEADPDLGDIPGVLTVRRRGRILSVLVKGDTADVRRRLTESGTVHMDEQGVKFEELFRALMEKEGYSRDAVLLS